jgi:hypothetical protein
MYLKFSRLCSHNSVEKTYHNKTIMIGLNNSFIIVSILLLLILTHGVVQ